MHGSGFRSHQRRHCVRLQMSFTFPTGYAPPRERQAPACQFKLPPSGYDFNRPAGARSIAPLDDNCRDVFIDSTRLWPSSRIAPKRVRFAARGKRSEGARPSGRIKLGSVFALKCQIPSQSAVRTAVDTALLTLSSNHTPPSGPFDIRQKCASLRERGFPFSPLATRFACAFFDN